MSEAHITMKDLALAVRCLREASAMFLKGKYPDRADLDKWELFHEAAFNIEWELKKIEIPLELDEAA